MTGHGGEVLFNIRAEKMAREKGITIEEAQRTLLRHRHRRFTELVKQGPVEIKFEGMAGPQKDKKKEIEGDLFYQTNQAKKMEAAIEGSLPGEAKRLKKQSEASYQIIGSEDYPIEADPVNQAKIRSVYEKKYTKYAPGGDAVKAKRADFIKELEAKAEYAAEQLEVLKILNERVKDKLSMIEDLPEGSPDRDKKLQELIAADPEFGDNLFKIIEINEHLREEEKRWQRDMALPKRFAEAGKSLSEDLGRGFFTTLAIFVGKFFKIGWQSIFLKGKKPAEKMKHFFKEVTPAALETVSHELYYVGKFGVKAAPVAPAVIGKLANVNRQGLDDVTKRAKKFHAETYKLLEKVYKEATHDSSMDTTN